MGRKVGQGFYAYPDGSPVGEDEPPAPSYDGRNVWISSAEPDAAASLRDAVIEAGGKLETGETPSGDALILVTPIGEDATSAAAEQSLDGTRTIAVDTLFGAGPPLDIDADARDVPGIGCGGTWIVWRGRSSGNSYQ